MRPLILITNDDGVRAKGLQALAEVAMEFGEVVVMAPELNASGKSHSITSERPLRAKEVGSGEWRVSMGCQRTGIESGLSV